MRFTIDTEVDSYEKVCEVVNTAYGRQARSQLPPAPPPLAEDEIWCDPRRPESGAWTEDMVRTWARGLPTTLDVQVFAYRICMTPGEPVEKRAMQDYLDPEGGMGAMKRVEACIRWANTTGQLVGRHRMPFSRDDRRRSYTAAPQVASVILEELSENEIFDQVIAHAAARESAARPKTNRGPVDAPPEEEALGYLSMRPLP
ncbi:hypothetical protein [Streptomyces millisiae]|uniref:Uncharacterized protein n=1 Tax=Streptomyces millisiae TaxID=3075542 RepID=A0ABU2LZX8_9ACTN|nr:hypothetical protein [Streptomyces sp. DSM 44918]MDT0323152.1 hypothetical protein [Streptomyces sp. DSM 44918]